MSFYKTDQGNLDNEVAGRGHPVFISLGNMDPSCIQDFRGVVNSFKEKEETTA